MVERSANFVTVWSVHDAAAIIFLTRAVAIVLAWVASVPSRGAVAPTYPGDYAERLR